MTRALPTLEGMLVQEDATKRKKRKTLSIHIDAERWSGIMETAGGWIQETPTWRKLRVRVPLVLDYLIQRYNMSTERRREAAARKKVGEELKEVERFTLGSFVRGALSHSYNYYYLHDNIDKKILSPKGRWALREYYAFRKLDELPGELPYGLDFNFSSWFKDFIEHQFRLLEKVLVDLQRVFLRKKGTRVWRWVEGNHKKPEEIEKKVRRGELVWVNTTIYLPEGLWELLRATLPPKVAMSKYLAVMLTSPLTPLLAYEMRRWYGQEPQIPKPPATKVEGIGFVYINSPPTIPLPYGRGEIKAFLTLPQIKNIIKKIPKSFFIRSTYRAIFPLAREMWLALSQEEYKSETYIDDEGNVSYYFLFPPRSATARGKLARYIHNVYKYLYFCLHGMPTEGLLGREEKELIEAVCSSPTKMAMTLRCLYQYIQEEKSISYKHVPAILVALVLDIVSEGRRTVKNWGDLIDTEKVKIYWEKVRVPYWEKQRRMREKGNYNYDVWYDDEYWENEGYEEELVLEWRPPRLGWGKTYVNTTPLPNKESAKSFPYVFDTEGKTLKFRVEDLLDALENLYFMLAWEGIKEGLDLTTIVSTTKRCKNIMDTVKEDYAATLEFGNAEGQKWSLSNIYAVEHKLKELERISKVLQKGKKFKGYYRLPYLYDHPLAPLKDFRLFVPLRQ